MPQPRQALILFTRYPLPGHSKTRLIPALGSQGAAALQRQLTEATLAQAESCCGRQGARLEIHFHGASHAAMTAWLGKGHFVPQVAGDLGQRLAAALERAFHRGHRQVLVIGADCPGLSAKLLHQAFAALGEHDLVLGPAMDGGYYLIGLRQTRPELFTHIPWGSDQVLAHTVARAQGLTIHFLPRLHDIDRPDDLVHLHHHPHP